MPHYTKWEMFITGTGQAMVNVHSRTKECEKYGCVIHHPSDHPMKSWPTNWRQDLGVMERICPHGVGHPDPDDTAYRYRKGAAIAGIHACDGCCSENKTMQALLQVQLDDAHRQNNH